MPGCKPSVHRAPLGRANKNERNNDRDMKIIPLTQDKVAYVDDKDFERVSRHKWHAIERRYLWYASTMIEGRTVLLHRFILNAPDDKGVDHRNGNGLENRRFNIRLCTSRQNLQNQHSTKKGTSNYKGVHLHRQTNKWIARIRVDGKLKYLGCFVFEHDAALTYNVAAKKYFGEFARLNVIVKPGESYSLFA